MAENLINNVQEQKLADSNKPIDGCGDVEDQLNPILSIRKAIRAELPEYSQLRPWLGYGLILAQWLVIALAVAASLYTEHWLVWLLAAIIIAGRQHALGVIGHDASHNRLSANKYANDFIADVFCWLPIFLCQRRYQHEHIQHHIYANTNKDPYWYFDFNTESVWQWPKSKLDAALVFVKDLLLINTKTNLKAGKRMGPFGQQEKELNTRDKLTSLFFYGLLIVFLTVTKSWLIFVVLWLLPLMTLTIIFVRIRTIGEHLGIPGNVEGIDLTRHIYANWFERLLVAPLNVNYHLDHHIFPSVPLYNLPKFHQRLLKEKTYRDYAHTNSGYFFGSNSVYKEVTT